MKEPPLEKRLSEPQSQLESCGVSYSFCLRRIEPLFLGRPSYGLVAIQTELSRLRFIILRLFRGLFNDVFRVEIK
jgi:hypothetical protein